MLVPQFDIEGQLDVETLKVGDSEAETESVAHDEPDEVRVIPEAVRDKEIVTLGVAEVLEERLCVFVTSGVEVVVVDKVREDDEVTVSVGESVEDKVLVPLIEYVCRGDEEIDAVRQSEEEEVEVRLCVLVLKGLLVVVADVETVPVDDRVPEFVTEEVADDVLDVVVVLEADVVALALRQFDAVDVPVPQDADGDADMDIVADAVAVAVVHKEFFDDIVANEALGELVDDDVILLVVVAELLTVEVADAVIELDDDLDCVNVFVKLCIAVAESG